MKGALDITGIKKIDKWQKLHVIECAPWMHFVDLQRLYVFRTAGLTTVSGQFFQTEKILAHSGIVVWSQDLMLSDLPVLNGKSHQNYPCGTTPTYIKHGGVSL